MLNPVTSPANFRNERSNSRFSRASIPFGKSESILCATFSRVAFTSCVGSGEPSTFSNHAAAGPE